MSKNRKEYHMKHYYVGHLFYLPLSHAISLINQGYSQDEALEITIKRFAYYGRHNTKRNKDFDQNQFRKHFYKFLNTKDAVLMRKSKKYK